MLRLGAVAAALQHVVVMVLLVVVVAVPDVVTAGIMIPMPLALSARSVAKRDIPSRDAGSGLINPSLEKTRVHLQPLQAMMWIQIDTPILVLLTTSPEIWRT
jgi:hypothetical protein